ncbi:Alpha/Beta hydrolase protein [Syncephalis pseudoplumigaleata]|uniref:Alpha/Beta hydrolase protein n=1 Tax=Syncephalis pseudoplumigaleata TaxID=1712513 RepID=A0A4P9YVV1_9FUNG|nr:Alpha/Beta hydrolase protein [Syncephalis pseudoplumigaleata]|eukprot:RKP24034.1 Alpha/Beta hydrolase protein [Syncephalis pseudoplumigaleata]
MLAGNYKDVPIIIGSTKDEAGFWSMLLGLPVVKQVVGSHSDYTAKGYNERTLRIFGNHSAEDALSIVDGHGANHRRVGDVHDDEARNNSLRVRVQAAKQEAMVCCHMADLLQTWKKESNMFLDAPQQRVATLIQRFWTNFAKTGDPNLNAGTNATTEAALIKWPKFDAKNRLHLSIDDEVVVTTNQREKYCQFWDKAGIDY